MRCPTSSVEDRGRAAASVQLLLDALLEAAGPAELMLDLKGRDARLAVRVADAFADRLHAAPSWSARDAGRCSRRSRGSTASASSTPSAPPGSSPRSAGGTSASPARICTPTIARINVVLPQPLGPSSPVTAPRG